MTAHRVGRSLLSAATALTFVTSSLHAQYGVEQAPDPGQTFVADRDWDDQVPAHLAVVDGRATLEREGRLENAEENLILLAGDRLRTERGRVEVLFADGSVLDVDEDTEIDLMSDVLMRLINGRVRLEIARAASTTDYRVDAAGGAVLIRTAGEYRIAAGDRSADPEVDVTVIRGSAELSNDYGRTLVRAGTRAVATARLAPSLPYVANSAAFDAFERWSDDRRRDRLGLESAQYLPTEVRYYAGAFDQYGSWGYEPSYGRVWYPRVSTGWRPYSAGRWSFSAYFGWTWVGGDRWSWPTHHYGRWGSSSGRWYWIPDRRWAPAWVAWGGAPGYVSWCPLGFDGRPVVAFASVSTRYMDPWSAWTIVPARVFAPNIVVTRHAVTHQAIAPSIRGQFAVRNAPVNTPVPGRRIEPLRGPGAVRGTAVPRDSRAWSTFGESRNPNGETRSVIRGNDVNGRAATPSDGARATRGVGASLPRSSASSPPSSSQVPSRIAPSRSAPATVERSPSPARSRLGTPAVTAPRINEPRIEAPRVESPRVGPRTTTRPEPSIDRSSPRALPRRDAGAAPHASTPPSTAAPSRVYRSREPEPASSGASMPPPRTGGWSQAPRSSAPSRVSPPAASPAPSTRSSGSVRSRSQPPSSDRPASAAPARSGGSSGRTAPASPSGGRGQAVPRGRGGQ